MSARRRVAFSVGSNLGDRAEHLQQGLRCLASDPDIFSVVVSPVYETEPVGGPEQPAYLNAVVRADSSLGPRQLLGLVQHCESQAGRVRSVRWGPRTLDVDVLAVDGYQSDDPTLTLPHPRAVERAFVLVPWCDVDPGFVVAGRPVREWLTRVGSEGVRETDVVLTSES